MERLIRLREKLDLRPGIDTLPREAKLIEINCVADYEDVAASFIKNCEEGFLVSLQLELSSSYNPTNPKDVRGFSHFSVGNVDAEVLSFNLGEMRRRREEATGREANLKTLLPASVLELLSSRRVLLVHHDVEGLFCHQGLGTGLLGFTPPKLKIGLSELVADYGSVIFKRPIEVLGRHGLGAVAKEIFGSDHLVSSEVVYLHKYRSTPYSTKWPIYRCRRRSTGRLPPPPLSSSPSVRHGHHLRLGGHVEAGREGGHSVGLRRRVARPRR